MVETCFTDVRVGLAISFRFLIYLDGWFEKGDSVVENCGRLNCYRSSVASFIHCSLYDFTSADNPCNSVSIIKMFFFICSNKTLFFICYCLMVFRLFLIFHLGNQNGIFYYNVIVNYCLKRVPVNSLVIF